MRTCRPGRATGLSAVPSPIRCAGAVEKQHEALLRRSLEAVIVAALHPRALIQVVVQVRMRGWTDW